MSVFLIIKIALFGCVYTEMLFLIQIATLKCKSIVLGILDTFLVWDNYSQIIISQMAFWLSVTIVPTSDGLK